MNRIAQVTEWADPRERIETVFGKMHYEHWLQREADRWANKWRDAWLQTNGLGEVALFTHASEQLPVEGDDPK